MQCRALVIPVIFLFPLLSIGQETKKWPVPGKDAQAKIEKLVEEIYDADIKKAANNPAERSRLAQVLLFEGKETKDDAAGRYVLLTKAHDLAALAGDVNTALAAADELAQSFAIPSAIAFGMKIKMLQKASQVDGATLDAYQTVVDRSLIILDDTLDADDYPSSLELIDAAEQAARKMKSVALVVSLRKKHDEITRLQKQFARWQPFADALAKNSRDANASLEMGKYYALIKGDFERGLPLLAGGPKSTFQTLAASDLNAKVDPLFKAESWRGLALKDAKDDAMKTHALLRAYHWYQESYLAARETERPKIDARLKEISDILPPEQRIGEIKSEVKRIDIPSGPVYGCAITPDARRLIATGYDGALRMYNAKTYKELRTLEGHIGKAWTVAVSNDGQHAVSGGFDGSVRLWDLGAGRQVRMLDGHKDYVRSVAMSSDGQWILSGGDDRSVRLWNASSGKEQSAMYGHDHTVWCVAIARDGKRGLSASLDRTARLWDLEKGESIRKLEGHADTVLCVAFSPNGQQAVTGSSDKTLRLWDLGTGQSIQQFTGSAGYVQSVAMSPDGRRILSAGSDNVVRLWDTVTGKEIRRLDGHRDQVWHVAFSRDGRFALSSGQDGSLRVWK